MNQTCYWPVAIGHSPGQGPARLLTIVQQPSSGQLVCPCSVLSSGRPKMAWFSLHSRANSRRFPWGRPGWSPASSSPLKLKFTASGAAGQVGVPAGARANLGRTGLPGPARRPPNWPGWALGAHGARRAARWEGRGSRAHQGRSRSAVPAHAPPAPRTAESRPAPRPASELRCRRRCRVSACGPARVGRGRGAAASHIPLYTVTSELVELGDVVGASSSAVARTQLIHSRCCRRGVTTLLARV